MFRVQNLATSLFPCGYSYQSCYYHYSTRQPTGGGVFCWNYSYNRHYQWCEYPCALYIYYTWGIQQIPACPAGTAIPGPVGPGDPVEALQALRQQLEVALAGVRAEEEELRRQRAAASREGA
jgi:hypothetical protein